MPDSNQEYNRIKLNDKLNLREDFPAVSFDEWKEQAVSDLKGAPYEKKLITKTFEGINLKPIYTREDLTHLEHLSSFPGFTPFMRGRTANGYLPGSWDICQSIPYGDPQEFNEALKYDLKRGQNSIPLSIDDASKLGFDADCSETELVGKHGVSISGLSSLARALKEIDITKYPVYINAGFSAFPLAAVFSAYLSKNNIDAGKIRGSFESDPISYLAEYGSIPAGIKYVYEEIAGVVNWFSSKAPDVKTLGVNGSFYGDVGANSADELAFTLSTAVDYINNLSDFGIEPRITASSIRFKYSVGSFYFMEVAKLRAARMLWYKILKEYGIPEAIKNSVIHAKTTYFNQTKYDPYVNMLRTTTEAFSAVVGGVDSLQTNPFDEVFGLPNEFSRRISRNVQIILSEESHLNKLIDPAGGSYFVETLTKELAEKAWEVFRDIQRRGGMYNSLVEGFPQEKVKAAIDARETDLRKRKEKLVGVNMYANIKEIKLEDNPVEHEELKKKRTENLQKFRVSVDKEKHQEVLNKLNKISLGDKENILDSAAEAVLHGATLGEIANAIRSGISGNNEVERIPVRRASELFENLRDAANSFKKKQGHLPKVHLINWGDLKEHKPRADFSKAFFETAGFEVIYSPGISITGEALKDTKDNVKTVVICSTDEMYPEIVPPIVKSVKDRFPGAVAVLAGYPKEQIEAHKEAGIDEFIFLGADVYEILSGIMKKTGVLENE